MARPGTPWRGFNTVVNALKIVKTALPESEIILFGDNHLFRQDIPFIYRDEGVISDQNHLATLYSKADIFVDGSDHQGFGRLALEAMACGTACVLTGAGGVMEYARHEKNCLIVPPRQPVALAEAILHLLSTPILKKEFIKEGMDTAKNYCLAYETQETIKYFRELYLLEGKELTI
jgi:glycosyltransferase involved in cell wall biosynthesis